VQKESGEEKQIRKDQVGLVMKHKDERMKKQNKYVCQRKKERKKGPACMCRWKYISVKIKKLNGRQI